VQTTRVTLSVMSDSPEIITRAIESMGRAAAGLALESIPVIMVIDRDQEQES
jgi:hypothetical protein